MSTPTLRGSACSVADPSPVAVEGRCYSNRARLRSGATAPQTWEFPGDEAHIPAEQPPSAQDTRLPPAHAHPRRPSHRGQPPAQGSRPACCLNPAMLPRAHRLSRSAEFAHVVRRGSRAGSSSVVLHEWVRDDEGPVRVGFVVSRGVGNAVRRNQVKRRLRHLMGDRLGELTAHSSVVVRASPVAATTGFSDLGSDLDSCLVIVAHRHQAMRARR